MTIREQHFEHVQDLYARGLTTMAGKNEDYAKEDDPYSNFRLAAQVAGITPAQSMLVLIGVKLARIENILNSGVVNNESLEDSILDAVNYLGILAGYEKLKNSPEDTFAYATEPPLDPEDEEWLMGYNEPAPVVVEEKPVGERILAALGLKK